MVSLTLGVGVQEVTGSGHGLAWMILGAGREQRQKELGTLELQVSCYTL